MSIFDLFLLAPEFREAVDPVGIRAESRGSIQHLDIRTEQGHDLFGGGPSEASVNNQIRLAMDQLAAWEANNA